VTTVSPQARRVMVYAGAGLLGAVGVVSWPVAATVAGVTWITQPRGDSEGSAQPTTTRRADATTASAKSTRTGRRPRRTANEAN